jgi:DNA ligase D
MADPLKPYRAKRNFAVTAEPAGTRGPTGDARVFVIQKHWARRLHYDLRLELGGVMKSWAVPKGPSYDPQDKRMAVQVEDHPIAYNQFEGEIPAGQYGAGKVIIWDKGIWTPLGDPRRAYREGKLKFALDGVKMRGHWTLVRMKGRDEKQPPWLLIKERDAFARPAREFSVVDELPDSVAAPAARPKPKHGASRATSSSSGKTARPAVPVPGRAAKLPAKLSPQLATLVKDVPGQAGDWLFEIKWDGYRILARIDGDDVRLFTRNGHDWTERMPHLARAVAKLGLGSGWLDGEIVVLTDDGIPSFQALQNAFDSRRTGDIAYCLFDAPFLAGRDLRREPLQLRRDLLRQVLGARPPKGLRFSEDFDAPPGQLAASACKMGLEGLIGKRRDSIYASRRSGAWIKLKCAHRQEFVIAGYTDPKGTRSGLGSLLLAVHDDAGRLQYAGNVGSGFDQAALRDLAGRLKKLETPQSPLAGRTPRDRGAHWVRPEWVAEVSFSEWTRSGHVRHAVFRGLRQDKAAAAIVRERPDMGPTKATGKQGRAMKHSPESAKTMRVTHPDRVVDPSTGTTKLDVVRYYARVAPLMLEHLKHRPVSLVRAPDGIDGEQFFQKHLESAMPGVKLLDRKLDPGHPPLLEVPTAHALVSAAQANVLEFHTWNATKRAIAKPDRMTFDLDPGKGVAWKTMLQAAELLCTFLEQLGLRAWLKTSGGKGLHVIVPVRRHYGWDEVKGFSRAIARHLATTVPQVFVAKSGPKNRVGRVFVDYLRNGFGATTVSAWSLRARPGLGISVPVGWDELGQLKRGAQWTLADVDRRLDTGNDPWQDYAPQAIGRAMKRLGFDPRSPGPDRDD